MSEIVIAVISAFFGSGLTAVINFILKRKLTIKQELQTDAQTDNIAVTTLKEAITTLNEEVYKPIQEENRQLKTELKSFTNELKKFRKAIEKIPTCDYAAQCPVACELQKQTGSDGSASKD